MAVQKTITITPVNADADGLVTVASAAGAGNITMNGALVLDGVYESDYPRRIGITSSGDDSGITFTLTGTDPDNKALVEAVAGSSAAPGTAVSDGYFKTVSAIYVSGATAGTITIGTEDELVTNTIPLDKYNHDPATVSMENVTGTIDFSLDETFTAIQTEPVIQFFEANETAFEGSTTATHGDISNHATAIRLRVNSYSSGAQLQLVINQNRPC